ncbi:hypothetical protein LTS08_007933 [Lithohypha guttulata]|uniref:carnosine N-methyltransferase n=1 Tax=Lithohypha guttulata TaxID=1690604 RepID=A0AAN7PHL9_9EURO|nr:hypothetical protein LTR05_008514 [Lithohypha guttulata]KAK5095798.1 hypothetical protein LTS08_007933 [Lithohypha guttulata]
MEESATAKQPFDSGPLADAGERRAIFNVLDSFRQYRKQTHFGTTHRRRQNFYALPKNHQDLLNSPGTLFLDNLSAIDDAIDENADIANEILQLGLETFDLPAQPHIDSWNNWHDTARPLDLDKAHSTLKQFWRDWSREGFEAELKSVLDTILHDVKSYLDSPVTNTRILLPGAGLGRLLFELCLAGYTAEGNEISYHQLLSSNFVLNTTKYANQYKLYPFINSFNNHTSRANQLRSVTIPDVHPSTAMSENLKAGLPIGNMSMTAGDFITSYTSAESAGSFDVVATVYFIDTAPNVIRYIETIHHCLGENGLWINIGPLLWHFEDRLTDKHDVHVDEENDTQNVAKDSTGIAEPGSFELTEEEVMTLVQRMGFEVIFQETLPPNAGAYIQDPSSMLQHVYRCSHWVARKTSASS